MSLNLTNAANLQKIGTAILNVLGPAVEGAAAAASTDANDIAAAVESVADDLSNHLITKDVAQLQLSAIAASGDHVAWGVANVESIQILNALKAGVNAAIGIANVAIGVPILPTIT